jgi:hypothetical protein
VAKDEKLNGLRDCQQCKEHTDVREDIVKAAKDLEFICSKVNRQCSAFDDLSKEVDKRLRIRPFYALISGLILILLTMLGIQLSTNASVGNLREELVRSTFEIKVDIAKHEGETEQIIKRVDDLVQEQAVLMDNLLEHASRNGKNHNRAP